jgi:L-ascorbate metabolism protein UlaG (beta-lactamase superfamily)
MRVRLLRHATLLIEYAGRRLLLDPMFSPAESQPPIGNAANDKRWPLVPLPMDEAALGELCRGLDGVLVTHTHRDHWDAPAIAALGKALPLVCQPPDAEAMAKAGFTAVTPVESRSEWLGISVVRTGGQHGRGALAERLGPVSGFVLSHADEPTLYVAGDTVWCDEVREAIGAHRPDVVVVNAGAAQFLQGGPITMDVDDIRATAAAAPNAAIVAVHFETVNHCLLSRAACAAALAESGLAKRVKLPADGDVLGWTGSDAKARRG